MQPARWYERAVHAAGPHVHAPTVDPRGGDGAAVRACELSSSGVYVSGVRVGRVTLVLLDQARERVIGLEVVTSACETWFLPWAAARFDGERVHANSLALQPPSQLAYYRGHGRPMAGHDAEALVGPDGLLVRRRV